MPKGMSKIEVLVVLLVMGVMGLVAGLAVSTARERTRDATRLAHVRELQDALESYFTDHGAYPINAEATPLGQSVTLCLSDDGFACTIAPDDAYLDRVPAPPTAGLKGRSSCGDVDNAYCYTSDGEGYTLQFELEAKNRYLDLQKGANCATSTDLGAGSCEAFTP